MRTALVIALTAVTSALTLGAEPNEAPTYEQLDRLIQAVNAVGRGGGGSAGLVAVDDRTVTTNYEAGAFLNGHVSLCGARTALEGTVPSMGPDGTLVWVPAASGALIVEGVSGTETTAAVCTNKLTFVSSPESNVKFTVTDNGGGNVEISVGVFYK